MIHLRDLDFAYESGAFRLKIPELSLSAGERAAWIGPSGSGKTTLLHISAGILLPTAGRVESCGVGLTQLGASARRVFRIRNVGLVFQEFELLDYLNVRDNILLAYRINRSLELNSAARDRAEVLANQLGVGKYLHRGPRQLSHGERQRVAVCRALVTCPQLVLADEPTANLDAENAARVLDALDDHAERHGATLVVVTHGHGDRSRFDRVIDLSRFCETPQTPIGGEHANGR